MLVDRGPFRRVSLKRYISHMSTANPHVVFDDVLASILDQQGFAWEDEPRSVYEPKQLYDALARYATEWDDYEFFEKHLDFGFNMAFKIFAKPQKSDVLAPLSDAEVIQTALKMSKSSGLPLMVKKSEALTYSFDRELQVRQGLKAPNPCVAYKRTQKGNKTRLVWGYPLEMTIMEARFARPLIDQFKRVVTPMAFGMTKVELGARLNRYIEDQPGTTVCLDYSKYDSTISRNMISRAFRILRTWFSREDRDSLGWDTMVRYFIFTPIVMPDGHLYTGKNHGVPSGSYFTQMIDSIVNVALCYALKSRFKLTFGEKQVYVLGDDVILKTESSVNLKEWASFLHKYGLNLHTDEKTIVGETHFLGAFWNKGKPDAPIQELINKAVFPENFRSYDGNRYVGAENVLRSYASGYLSAFRLLPNERGWDMDCCNRPRVGIEDADPRYMTGSDKFFEEEYALIRRKRLCASTLALRYLL